MKILLFADMSDADLNNVLLNMNTFLRRLSKRKHVRMNVEKIEIFFFDNHLYTKWHLHIFTLCIVRQSCKQRQEMKALLHLIYSIDNSRMQLIVWPCLTTGYMFLFLHLSRRVKERTKEKKIENVTRVLINISKKKEEREREIYIYYSCWMNELQLISSL